MPNDMNAVTAPKSDQWNFDDFRAGPITFKITGVRVKSGQEQPVDMSVEGSDKFYRPCKSMARVLVAAWGPDSSQYVGKSLTLYGDPKVKWGGMEVGGIRISHMTGIQSAMQMMLTVSKANRAPFTVKPLEVAPPPVAEDPPISDEQEARVTALLDEHGVPLAEVLAFGGWEDIRRDMPARLFNSVCAWIRDDKQVRTKPKARTS